MSFVDRTIELLGFDVDSGVAGALLAVFATLGILLQCFYLLTVPPTTGYETSIYAPYPAIYWVAVGGVLIAGLLLFLLAAIAGTTHWKAGLVFVGTNYGLMFALPIFRGYRLYGRGAADRLGHLSDVHRILETGSAGGLFYPLQHIVMADIVYLTGLSSDTVSYFFPFVVMMLYVGSVGVLARYLTNRRAALSCGFCAATPLLFTHFHFTIHPAMLSFMLVPLFAFLFERYRRHQDRRNLGLVALFGAIILVFHPMTTLFVIVFLVASSGFFRLYARFGPRPIRRVSLLIPTALAIVWFIWSTAFSGTRGLIRNIVRVWLQGGYSVGQSQVSRATSISFTPTQLALQFVDLYGPIFIYLLAAGLVGLAALVRLYRDREDFTEVFFTFHFGVGFVLSVLFLMVYFIASNPVRISRYMVVMAVLLVAVFLSRMITRPVGRRRIAAAVLAVAVVSAALLAAGTAYRPNNHLTEAEYDGSEFMLRNHDTSVPIRAFAMSRKMEYYVLGSDRSDGLASLQAVMPRYQLAPALGYDENRTAAKSFGESYLITKEFDYEFYKSDTYTEPQREAVFLYDQSHIRRLSRDPTVQKVYSNERFEGWIVSNRSRQSTT